MLDEPLQMANPRKAFTENPWVDCEVDLDLPRHRRRCSAASR